MKRLLSAILVAALTMTTLLSAISAARADSLGSVVAASAAAADDFNWNGVWQYSAAEQWNVGSNNPLAGSALYRTVNVTETLTVSPYDKVKEFSYIVKWERTTDDGENPTNESGQYLAYAFLYDGGGGKSQMTLVPYDGTSVDSGYYSYRLLYETDAGDVYSTDFGKTYVRIAEGLSMERVLAVSGVLLGPDGKALPRMKMAVDVYYDESALTQVWENDLPDLHEALTSDLNGAYLVKIPIRGDIRTKIGIVITLTLRCQLLQGDAFFLADDQDPNAKDEIRVSTLAVIDPAEAIQANRDLNEIPVARALQFSDAPKGYLSTDDSGAAEPMQTNLGDVQKFLGYSYLYRVFWDALTVGGVLFDELPCMLQSPTGDPLRIDLNHQPQTPDDRSHYSAAANAIRLTANYCRFDDPSRYVALHEFGHFFDAATNQWKHRCDYAAKIQAGDLQHGGYLNRDTADSFVEGFATWYACVCQIYRKDVKPYVIGAFGDLEEPGDWRAWANGGTQEEFSIAAVLLRIMYQFDDIQTFWKAVLRSDEQNFYGYYGMVRVLLGGKSSQMARIRNNMIDAGLFRMPSGNGQYDPGEPYRDLNNNGHWDPQEPYGDLMFPYDASIRWIDSSSLPASFNRDRASIGESAAYNLPNRRSVALEDNGFVALSGEKVDALKVAIRLADGASYAYVASPETRGIYVGLPNGAHQGTVEISVPGGGVIYRGDVRKLQEKIAGTMGQSVPLDSAGIAKADMAPDGTIAAPTGGDANASGVFVPVEIDNREAGILSDHYDPEAEISSLPDVNISVERPDATEAPEETAVPKATAMPKATAAPEGAVSRSPITDVAAGEYFTLGLRQNGTVVAAGDNGKGQCDVSGWTEIEAISAGLQHSVGLTRDGAVVATGDDELGQCDVADWEDIVQISAGYGHTVGLKADGTVVAAGYNGDGQCNVGKWRDIVAIAAGGWHTIGLKDNGTVVATGYNKYGQCDVKKWSSIAAVAAGGWHTLGIKKNGRVVSSGYGESGQRDVGKWRSVTQVSASGYHTVGLFKGVSPIAVGNDDFGQCEMSLWEDVTAIVAGGYHTVGLLQDGSVVAVGNNDYGQCEVADWGAGTAKSYDGTGE